MPGSAGSSWYFLRYIDPHNQNEIADIVGLSRSRVSKIRIDTLEKIGLAVPQVTYLMRELKKKGFNVSEDIFTVEKAKSELLNILLKNK